MPRKHGKESGSLGKTLIKNRFRGQRTINGERALTHTSDLDDGYDWARLGGVSITEQGALEEFLSTAELAGTDFTAERLNVQVVTQFDNEALPSQAKRDATQAAQHEHRKRLRIPRRPDWTRDMTKEELDMLERESFLEWRRGLAELEQTEHIIMTPFERNLDFWRQFWRVVERSDVVVQIVDARNPLLFRCADVEEYVNEIDPSKRNILLVNKADLLTDKQRVEWAEYFTQNNIEFVFFSAALEAKKNEMKAEFYLRNEHLSDDDDDMEHGASRINRDHSYEDYDTDENVAEEEDENLELEDDEDDKDAGDFGQDDDVADELGALTTKEEDEEEDDDDELVDIVDEDADPEDVDSDGKQPVSKAEQAETNSQGQEAVTSNSQELFDTDRLLEFLESLARAISVRGRPTIGMVGYPNVGKSSTINAICRSKKVSVSATPGKTKHFQTILLGDLELCDCPGLVFPNFANTKAELVCNGILPIDQLRDVIPPATYVVQHIPRRVLEETYGIMIIQPAEDEDPDRPPTAQEFLNAYSFARGFMNARGLPDISRGARIVLKDFVKGKLLYCEPPPGYEPTMGTTTFLSSKKPTKAKDMDSAAVTGPRHRPTYANEVDDQFFRQTDVKAVIKSTRKNSAFSGEAASKSSKKHNKKNKREKIRRAVAVKS
eukprot:m.31605 g.31605  ORF g.31605 m.31605 type:complete len:664 (+) comp10699_c0_seq1:118-2109(+)